MRILKPEVAKQRKEKILNWLVYQYITTGKPISSNDIFSSKLFGLSPATIRNILKELDDEGYLEQVHISGGRIPTDKAYRFYIDNLLSMQAIAEKEKEKIEIEYERRIAELDYFLKYSTKLLSDLTNKIGFSIVNDISDEHIKRIDIVKVSNFNYLFILITHSGIIKHYPISIEKNIDKANLRAIVSTLNKRFKDLTLKDIKKALIKDFINKDETGIYTAIYKLIESIIKEEEDLLIEGLNRIYRESDDFSIEELRAISKLLEEKEKFSRLLKEKFEDKIKQIRKEEDSNKIDYDKTSKKSRKRHLIDVSIGSENQIKELQNFSLISSCYSLKDKSYGVIGVIGHKRMEYPRVISIVDAVSDMIEEILTEWDKEFDM